jgi:ATP-dependent RNA helicase RhlE
LLFPPIPFNLLPDTLSRLADPEARQGTFMTMTHANFHGLGIAPGLLSALDALHFKTPTPIQHKAIPIAMEGKDIIGIAQTGTGKTLAFGLPMIQRLAQQPGRGLVLVPTRELALQAHEMLQKFLPIFKMRSVALIGGESMFHQVQRLREEPRIVIATPGRLIDHLGQKTIRLNEVRILVLDEADRMLDMGFQPQIERILHVVPRQRQTMLFSATMPSGILKIASHYMQLPVRTEIAPSGTAAEKVSQELFMVSRELKGRLLAELLKKYSGSVLLFVRTRRGATKVTRLVRGAGHTAAEIHANRSQSQRKEALRGFKTGEYRVLVATDIAARGIDVSAIELVINFDLPDDPDSYVHRIGRTGRAGHAGHAITLATPDQHHDVRAIEKLIRASIPRAKLPDWPDAPPPAPAAPAPGPHRPSHRGHRSFGRRRTRGKRF